MTMRYFEVRKARIEIVPMIDIMLFLLVFFAIITLHMIPSTGVTSQLPHSSTATQTPHPKVLVGIATDGTISVDQRTLDPAGLTALLAAGDAAQTAVTIASAQSVSVQQLMTVIDACRLAGVVQIALAALPQP